MSHGQIHSSLVLFPSCSVCFHTLNLLVGIVSQTNSFFFYQFLFIKKVGRMGKIDNASLRLLSDCGVRLNTWGNVADINKYNNLMSHGLNEE